MGSLFKLEPGSESFKSLALWVFQGGPFGDPVGQPNSGKGNRWEAKACGEQGHSQPQWLRIKFMPASSCNYKHNTLPNQPTLCCDIWTQHAAPENASARTRLTLQAKDVNCVDACSGLWVLVPLQVHAYAA